MVIWTAEIKELERLHESFKGQFPELEKELVQLIHFDDPNVILLYSRRCLEVIITDLCECELNRPRGTEPLQGIIDKLQKEKKIPVHIIASMHGLNELSTFGTHPKDFDPEQVKPVLVNLDIIIKWYLKNKESRTGIKVKTYEKNGQDIKSTEDAKRSITISRKKLAGLISGSIVILVVVFMVLFLVKIFGGGKQTREVGKSIAVLPFKLLSDEPDKQYLADGMVDAITLHLSKVHGLRVMSRTSGEQYRITTKTTRTIGKELDVQYLLEGSLQKFGDDVKLIVQLIKAEEESHEWANEYYSKLSDIFSLQSEIAQKIAKEMSFVLSPEEKEYINKAPTADLRAYDFYLRGFSELWKLGQHSVDRESIEKAEILFNQALQYDTSFALAYVGLGHVYWKRSYLPEGDSINFMDSVLVLANIALSYDDKLAEAYYLRGAYYLEKGDLKKTEEEWDKAIQVNPNQWHVYAGRFFLPNSDLITKIENTIKAASLNHDIGFSTLLIDLGYSFFEAGFPGKASYYYNEVLKLDGDSVRYLYSLAEVELYITGNYNKSLELLEKVYAIDSTSSNLDYLYALNYMFTGQFKKSLKHLNRLKSAGRINEFSAYRIAFIYWINGYKEEAESYFDKGMNMNLKNIGNLYDDANAHYIIACIYAVRGDKEEAFESLKLFNQYEKNGELSWVTLIKNDPMFNNIKKEPWFQQIVIDAESRHRAAHEKVRKWLEEKGML